LSSSTEEFFRQEKPHIVIIDMEVGPQVAGMIRAIKATAPGTRIILLGGVGSMDRAKGAFPQGVDGVVLTMQPPAVLIRMIELYVPIRCGAPE
jgi:DNA-binding NarL/FixJ family response regulator